MVPLRIRQTDGLRRCDRLCRSEEADDILDMNAKECLRFDTTPLQVEDREQVERAIAVLNYRERFVIERRFGLNGRPEMTLEDIGSDLQLGRERIRQIAHAALRKCLVALEEAMLSSKCVGRYWSKRQTTCNP